MSLQLLKSRVGIAFVGGLVFISLIALSSARYRSSGTGMAMSSNQRSSSNLLDDINNATLGFQKIFVLNLPSRTDHRDAVSLAAHLTGLKVDYIDGVTHVEQKTLPPPSKTDFNDGQLGNWRAHMNALRTMVEHNISSALILEDDSDWDVNIKSQMQDLARASHFFFQPLAGTSNTFLDKTIGRKTSKDEKVVTHDLANLSAGKIRAPTTSPYGDLDRWDLFWLGHCGTIFPAPGEDNPLMRISVHDKTVPEKQHIEMQFGNDDLMKEYPAHTRVFSRAHNNICSLGYAVSLPGARRMLYELALHRLDYPTDISIKQMCEGVDRKARNCLTVQPQLFQHHRPIGPKSAESDITAHPGGDNTKAFTRNIRYSTRINFGKLLDFETDWIDQFPDGAEKQDLGF